MAMIRKQIYIDAATNKRLKAEAKRRKMSEAAIIRERLTGESPTTDDAGVQAALDWLAEIRAQQERGPRDDWTFSREEVYAERLDKALSRGHQRASVRERSKRGA